MIKPQLSIASIQHSDREKIMRNIFIRRMEKIINDFDMHPTVIQLAPGKSNGKYRWIGDFIALIDS